MNADPTLSTRTESTNPLPVAGVVADLFPKRVRLAELEAGFTMEKAKVAAMKARLRATGGWRRSVAPC